MMRRTARCYCGGSATSCEGFSARPVQQRSRGTAEDGRFRPCACQASAGTFSLAAGLLSGVRAAFGEADLKVSRQDGSDFVLVGRAEQLPFPDATFDALTFSYLMRYVADPAPTIRELARVIRPGG
jgi:SAM-dependent methyltransferase